MKKIGIVLLMALLLVGCTPKAYKENLNNGLTELEDGNFAKAVEYFETAEQEKSTKAIKELLKIATLLNDASVALTEGDYDKAIKKAEKVKKFKVEEKDNEAALKTAKEKAKEILKQAETEKALKEEIEAKLEEGKKLLESQKFDEAYELFNEIATSSKYPDNQLFTDLVTEATELSKEVTSQKESAAIEAKKKEEQKKQEEEKKKDENNQGGTNGVEELPNPNFTTADAEKLVRKHLGLTGDKSAYVEFDHTDEKGNYIIHVYQVVVDEEEGYGHTVTYGWYSVNPKTKKVSEAY